MSTETSAGTKAGRKHVALRKIVGALMFLMGLFWFAKRAGWMPADHAHSALFWPAIVIIAGLFVFLSEGHRRNQIV